MTRPGEAAIIPARLTAAALAEEIGRSVEEVIAVMTARGIGDASDEVVDATEAIEIAKTLGVEVAIEARDLALERLYAIEARGTSGETVEGRAGELVAGVLGNLTELDELIESVSEHWSVARMPLIDRNILRIGAFELSAGTPPTAVVVAEGVRLAQTYSTEKSPAFVNGVLANIAKTLKR